LNYESPELIELSRAEDSRGFFEQSFPSSAISRLDRDSVYVASSWAAEKHSIRGLHYQEEPFGERKLVRVIAGRVLDVVVNLDKLIPMETRIQTFELSSDVPRCLYIPKGFAHGFQSLEDDTIVLYCLDNIYAPQATKGLNPLSPVLANLWPFKPSRIKEADLLWPDLT
jgi:dTDP-4-dehydrorhamnose 3,5-epimerase